LEPDELGREFHTPTILTPKDGISAPIQTLSQSEINSIVTVMHKPINYIAENVINLANKSIMQLHAIKPFLSLFS
jgi:hypothetical protein